MGKIRKLKITGMTWLTDRSAEAKKFLDKFHLFGHCSFEERKIRLHPDMDRERDLEVTLHEIFHVMLEQTGLDHLKGVRINNEPLSQGLGHGWFQVLADNASLREAIYRMKDPIPLGKSKTSRISSKQKR